MFKCLIIKRVKRLDDCSGLYNYLSHQANEQIRCEVGLAEKLPHLKTFQRRFEQSAHLMRIQLQAVAQSLAAKGVITFEILSVDGTVCDALGPDWHKWDKLYAHIPPGLRNVDLTTKWAKSGYRGWSYGYKALALCNSTPNEPAMFVDGWVEKGIASETLSVREQIAKNGLPADNRVMLADSGFDDKNFFEVCREFKSLLVTPVKSCENSPQERFLKEALYVDYLNCGIYGRRSTSIEPLLVMLNSYSIYKYCIITVFANRAQKSWR